MKRLTIQTGGFPFKNDDLDYLQSSYLETFEALCKSFAIGNVGFLILYGCETVLASSTATTDTYDISEGWAMFNFEFVFCPAQTVSVNRNAPLEAYLEIQYYPTGVRNYVNNVTNQTHQDKYLKVRQSTQSGADFPFEKLPQSINNLFKKSFQSLNIANNVIFLNTWALLTGDLTADLEGNLKALSFSDLKTSITFRSASAGDTEEAFTLPQELWPVRPVIQTLAGTVNSYTFAMVRMNISTLGVVSFTRLDGAEPLTINAYITYF